LDLNYLIWTSVLPGAVICGLDRSTRADGM
jgi:hypothetical protein